MRLTGSTAGRFRRALEIGVPPRARFYVFRIAAWILPSRVGPSAFLRLASEFAADGSTWHAKQCWRILRRMAPMDTRIALQRVVSALDAADVEEANLAMDDAARATGVPPRSLIGFAGELAARGHFGSAARVLVRLGETSAWDRLIEQNPSFLSNELAGNFDAVGRAMCAEVADDAALRLLLARLCFAFRHPVVSVQLYTGVESRVLTPMDRAAMLQASAQGGRAVEAVSSEELRVLMRSVGENPDALGAVAQAAVAAGRRELAHEALDSALNALSNRSTNVREASEDCHAILDVLADLHGNPEELSPLLRTRTSEIGSGVPKVFVCGFGWSGSGAVYDAIRGAEGFCEFEGSGVDPVINADADSEVTFIQGGGGLGDLWERAIKEGRVSWTSLWQLFALHVVGISAVGYAQYKSSAAARNHLSRYGTRYTRPFRTFLEKYAALVEDPRRGALHACLLDTTESLCSMLIEQTGARAVLFNNAIFGRNARMLEIFRSSKAAVVYRDPRDVYVDRRKSDRNHWRTPAQLGMYYAYGLRCYADYKEEEPVRGLQMREVSFERFVKDRHYRTTVSDWLLEDLASRPSVSYFQPELSIKNIGTHLGALAGREKEQLDVALNERQRLERLSSAAWS